jgi:hypothetical protein
MTLKYACKGKEDILNRLSTIIIHAPNDFPAEFEGMDMSVAWATIEYGLIQIEVKDGRPEVMDALAAIRGELTIAQRLFEQNKINQACHKLRDVEDILGGLKVKAEVR